MRTFYCVYYTYFAYKKFGYSNIRIVVTEYRIVLEFFISKICVENTVKSPHVGMKIKDQIFLISFGHKFDI